MYSYVLKYLFGVVLFNRTDFFGAFFTANGEQQVNMIQPFTSKDFAIRTLPDRLYDLAHLLYLYPETPKEKAFAKYYTPVQGNILLRFFL